jgi:pyruvate dehydrogenase E2 component (dihydrolipoamide acetyltransferase)
MIEINMPVIGHDIPTGIVLEWLKMEGDPVRKDEVIAAVQSEKADFDVEAPASGILLKILKNVGDEAEVLTPIGYIGKPGEIYMGTADEEEKITVNKKGERSPAPVTSETHAEGKILKKGKVVASPLARKVAREAGIPLGMIRGTGPEGRIIKKNVLAFIRDGGSGVEEYDSGQDTAGSVQGSHRILSLEEGDRRESYSRVRQVIADRMTYSCRNIPHFYLNADIPMDQAVSWRVSTNQSLNTQITFTDILVHVAATLLREFPRLNAHADDKEIIYKRRINIGVAVATSEGLLVPVIPDADQKDILSISHEVKGKSVLARDGKLDLSTRGTFTISSLGMYDITSFQPVINPPETGILAIGKIEDRMIVLGKTMEFRKKMTVTLACDHRAVDGAYGAEFLKRFSEMMETANFRITNG